MKVTIKDNKSNLVRFADIQPGSVFKSLNGFEGEGYYIKVGIGSINSFYVDKYGCKTTNLVITLKDPQFPKGTILNWLDILDLVEPVDSEIIIQNN